MTTSMFTWFPRLLRGALVTAAVASSVFFVSRTEGPLRRRPRRLLTSLTAAPPFFSSWNRPVVAFQPITTVITRRIGSRRDDRSWRALAQRTFHRSYPYTTVGSRRAPAAASTQQLSSYVSPLHEAVTSLLGGVTSSLQQPGGALIDAAASLTQDSCRLLGMKSVGVDYGLSRTGIAVTVGFEPKPLEIVHSNNQTSVVCQHVIRHARREQAGCVVVGLPLHKNGSVAEQTGITLDFCRELAACVLAELGPAVRVLLWDERYTSKEAAARAHSRDPDRFLYGTLDADAACVILEHFYHDNGVGAVPIEVNDEAVRLRCLQAYEARQKVELQRKKDDMAERERKLQRRKDAIARGRVLEVQLSSSLGSEDEGASSGKRKKRRKKKR